ncbi:MAG: GNAT family N-acetyltransferase [Candidatus Pacebacteria bacterium]|nr:GNAT family N-acetyltransferase [Candidatus Paceibacterota bacterium]
MKVKTFLQYKHQQQAYKIFKSYPNLFTKAELKILREDLKTGDNKSHFKFVAVDKEQVVGFISLATCYATDYSWQVNWLAVHPDFQRLGVGRLLINFLFQKAKKLGLKRLFVETCSCQGEKPARLFYQKHGFKKIARLPDFYARKHSKVIYLKNIVE